MERLKGTLASSHKPSSSCGVMTTHAVSFDNLFVDKMWMVNES